MKKDLLYIAIGLLAIMIGAYSLFSLVRTHKTEFIKEPVNGPVTRESNNNLPAEGREPSLFSTLTFCEELINMRRLLSSAYPVPAYDVLADEYYFGEPAGVDFTSYPEARNFRTRISEAAAEGPNFAGRFTVAEWGCGSNCQNHAVIDARSGNIIAYGLASELGAEYSLDSKILILNPKKNLPALAGSSQPPFTLAENFARLPREYYVLKTDAGTNKSYLSLACTESAGAHYLLEAGCTNFGPDNCPANCVVCPPCPACSSISCQSEAFCAEMGIDRSWYDGIKARITNFEECVAAGNAVMESDPRQCRSYGQVFVERMEKTLPCDGPPDVCEKE